VLKVDNGSAWRGHEVQAVLLKWMVLMLFSPPYTPEYNGSIESGIGAAKERTQERSERRGAPGVWSWEDVEGARQEGNLFGSSPFAPNRSPEQVWQSREPIRQEEREALAHAVMRIETEVQQETAGQCGGAGQEAPSKEGIWRAVLSRALRALGLLVIRWGRISTGVSEKKRTEFHRYHRDRFARRLPPPKISTIWQTARFPRRSEGILQAFSGLGVAIRVSGTQF